MPRFFEISTVAARENTFDVYENNYRATFYVHDRLDENAASGGNFISTSTLNLPFNRTKFTIDFIDFNQAILVSYSNATTGGFSNLYNEKSMPFYLPVQSILSYGLRSGSLTSASNLHASFGDAIAQYNLDKKNSFYNETIIRPETFTPTSFSQAGIRNYTYYPIKRKFGYKSELSIKEYSLQILILTAISVVATQDDQTSLLTAIDGFVSQFDANITSVAMSEVFSQITISGQLG